MYIMPAYLNYNITYKKDEKKEAVSTASFIEKELNIIVDE